jgi:hypothetical protein
MTTMHVSEPPIAPAGYLLQLRAQADLTAVAKMPRGADRRDAAWRELEQTAARTQPAVLTVLDELRRDGVVVSIESVPLANSIAVEVDRAATARFEARMRQVDALGWIGRDYTDWSDVPPQGDDGVRELGRPAFVEGVQSAVATPWHLDRVGAPSTWRAGLDGTGVRIGVIDSGANVRHPSLRTPFERAHVDYRWHDFVYDSPTPDDASNHGSGAAGVAVGGAPGRATGVAPGAELIVARGGGAEDAPSPNFARLQALDWMLAPGDPTRGIARDARRGADIVSNSWGVAPEFAGVFDTAIGQLVAAGTVVVFSAGNGGPDAGTVEAPGSSAHAITVGASSDRDEVDWYSARGPVVQPDGSRIRKPDLVAPGSMKSAAGHGSGYQDYGMTSGAAPMVAGAAAILLQRYPQLTPEQVRTALTHSAVDIGVPGPDDDSGYGRLNLPAALAAAAQLVGDA